MNSTSKAKMLALKPNEFYGMEFQSGYKTYYVFGTDIPSMFKQVIQMYSSYSGHKYTVRQFRTICSEECYSCFLYKFVLGQLFSFDDDCYSLGERGGTLIGDYFKMY